MNFKSFEKTDRKIITTAGVLLLLSGLLIWQDGWIYRLVQTRRSDLEQIGRVVKQENDVRRRYQVALSWLPIKRSADVYQGDSIFTGRDSSVVIETTSGEQLTVAPNSLVVVNQKQDSISLNISFGSVEGRVENGKKLVISSNNSLTELDGKNAVIKVDAGEGSKLLLSVISGEVRVRSPSGDRVLRQDDAAEILTNGDTQEGQFPNVALTSPMDGSVLRYREEAPVLFSWKTRRPANRTKIKIATDSAMKNVIVDSRLDGTTYSAYNLPLDATLYWQVLTESGSSPIAAFDHIGSRPPVLVYPKQGHQFFFEPLSSQQKTDVNLSWEPGSPARRYEIEIAKDGQFRKNVNLHKTKEKTFSLAGLTQGEYFWRVRAADYSDQVWSSPGYFKVGPEPSQLLAPPVPLVISSTFLIPTRIHGESFDQIHALRPRAAQKYIASRPHLTWSKVAGADRYEIQISKSKKFSQLVAQDIVTEPAFKWRAPEPGLYYWRVKALSESFKDGLYTKTQELKVQLAPPQMLSQALIVDEVPDILLLEAAPPPLHLKWNPTILTQGYEVEVSQSSDFQKPTRFLTKRADKKVQIAAPGIYFWRVRSLDEKQLPASPYSTTYTIEFQRVYKDPTEIKNLMALYPKQQDSIILVGREKSELEFKWSRPYENAQYRLEISTDPAFESVFFSTLTPVNYFKFSETFPARVIYWRVRAEDKKFVSEWTGANRFLVTYESKPFDFAESDFMFAARIKAKERQSLLIAARERRLATLRGPASNLQLRLDTPLLLVAPTEFTIESNLDPQYSPAALTKIPFEKFYAQVREYPQIKWQKVPAAERYVVEIARDRDFSQMVVKTPTWEPHLLWDTARPGRFYYRVQAFNDRYERSYYSPPVELTITVASPIPTSTDTFVEVFDEPKDSWQPPSPFTLSWLPVAFARGYEVEFSETKNFDLVKVFRTRQTSGDFRVSKTGLYYWRVRPISDRGSSIGHFSSIRSVEIIQTNRAPASVTQLTGLFPIERTMLFVGKGLMNLAFHWVSPEPEDEYHVEVAADKGFRNVLARVRGHGTKAIVNKDLPAGRLYWRVISGGSKARGLASERKVSPVAEFTLERETAPYAPPAKTAEAKTGH
jgi:hypothetical protein